MNSNDLTKALIDELMNLKYNYKYSDGSSYYTNVINKENRELVTNSVNSIIRDYYDRNIGILEAKVYTYEHIIANSNFKPILLRKKDE